MRNSPYPAVRSLTFSVDQGEVKIRGQVPSFYTCQIAIESVRRVPGVVRIINQTEIVYNSVPRARDEQDSEVRWRIRSSVPPPAIDFSGQSSGKPLTSPFNEQ